MKERLYVSYINELINLKANITTGKITSVNGSIVKTQIVGYKGFDNIATFNI